MIPILGQGASAISSASQRIAGFREIDYDANSVLGFVSSVTGIIDNDMIITISKWAGRAISVIAVGKYAYDWFFAHNYQIEEAIYNQFASDIWISDTRDLVDRKFNY